MVNYSLKFSFSDISKILNTPKNTIRNWDNHFLDYLSPKETATPRKFNLNDIRVLAFISKYWNSMSDIDEIKKDLSCNEHLEDESIDILLQKITPPFYEIPDDIDETWRHGVLYTGLSSNCDLFNIASSYKIAADRLIDIAIDNDEAINLYCPILFNYRHALELYIKSCLDNFEENHKLTSNYNGLEKLLKERHGISTIPAWFKEIFLVFQDFDPFGTTFRYGDKTSNYREIFIDLRLLKTRMNWIGKSFDELKYKQMLA